MGPLAHSKAIRRIGWICAIRLRLYSATHRLSALMTLLWPLSLNGGTQVAYALGTAAGYGADCATGLKRSNKPMRKAQQILEMANGLAEKLARSESVALRVSCPSAVVQLLSDSACAEISGTPPFFARHFMVPGCQSRLASTVGFKRCESKQ